MDVVRVMHVIERLRGGGAEVSLRELAPALRACGIVQAVTALVADDEMSRAYEADGIEVFAPARPLRNRFERLRHVHRAVRVFEPLLVHTAVFEADLAGRLTGLVTRTPVLTSLINTPNGVDAPRPRTLMRVKQRGVQTVDALLARHATGAFHAVSEAAADAAVRRLRIDRRAVVVVPRGRRPDRLGPPSAARRARVRARLSLGDRPPVLLHMGRQEPQKGQVHLLHALAEVRESRPDVVLLVAGREGRSSRQLRDVIAQHALEQAVRLLGPREDVGDLLAAADVFVFPSLYEGLGGAVLEAMAMRTPIVASDIPACREVLDQGRCGLLVPPADPAALAVAINEVLARPAQATRRATAAHARFAETYSFEAMMDGMLALYRDLHVRLAQDQR